MLRLPLDAAGDASRIAYGFFITDGRGTAWMDGLTLETVGKDVPVARMGRSLDDCHRTGRNR